MKPVLFLLALVLSSTAMAQEHRGWSHGGGDMRQHDWHGGWHPGWHQGWRGPRYDTGPGFLGGIVGGIIGGLLAPLRDEPRE
jgi:hypothetical protein